MKKRILITGAGSGFGEGTAIGLAQKGHEVIAGMHIWPQVTQMRRKAESLRLNNLRAEKLDILDPHDVENALKWDIDILVNNAAIGYAGPLSEVPLEFVRQTFETNFFATLNLTQKFIRKFVDKKHTGKIVFISSVAGLSSLTGLGPYAASKHAIECVAETLQNELKPYNIKIQTINPGPFRTGFNDAMAESAFRWLDDKKNFNKKNNVKRFFEWLKEGQLDPQEMINEMIKIIPAPSGKFRNVFPKDIEDSIKESQVAAWKNKI
jgi:short-subunit dehydrogenase